MSVEPSASSSRPPTQGALPVSTPSSAREPLRPMPASTIALISAGILVLTVGVVIALWWPGTAGLSGQALVTARFDALRTGLSIGIGSGGIFALYLAWRRQHATEVGLIQKERDQADVARAYELQRDVAEHTRLDAEARRVTELYIKASEQLGSDKAPVRLAGLYTLERLGQDNPDQRPTIASLWCSYLRMPYIPPVSEVRRSPAGVPRPLLRNPRRHVGIQRPDPAATTPSDLAAARIEAFMEYDVRLSVQRMLAKHLRPQPDSDDRPHPHYWSEIPDLDLSKATLIDLDLSSCVLPAMHMDRATFTGPARFSGARFSALAWFDDATFERGASFDGVTFDQTAWFGGARFGGGATFHDAKFGRGGVFAEATFEDYAWFHRATFGSGASFGSTTFHGEAEFGSARFDDEAVFRSARFGGNIRFESAVFVSTATCNDAWAWFVGEVGAQSTWPPGWRCVVIETTNGDVQWGRFVPVPVVLAPV